MEQALNTPASEPIKAESNPATTMPRNPAGNMYLTISGNAAWVSCGIGLPSGPIISSANSANFPLLASAKQIIPGMMNR